MPNDIRIGLVGGIALLLLTGVLCFRKDLSHFRPRERAETSAAFYQVSGGPRSRVPAPASPPARATPERTGKQGSGYWHRIQQGDTLIGLAQRFYGDGDRFADIYDANRNVLDRADPLPTGVVIFIPDAVRAPPIRSAGR
jgi:nucleoid-associated protein YgaU